MEITSSHAPLYFKKLDTLRFVAFFLVFWQHGFFNYFVNIPQDQVNNIISPLIYTGGIGVHIFFVISGFLITFLMIKENNETGSVSLKNFYIRRILRIWPLYYLVLLLGIFVFPHLSNHFQFSGDYFRTLLFLNNYAMENQSENISIAWTVAIEEQFYLFWPILFILVRNRTWLAFICLAVFAYSTFFIYTHTYPVSYLHSISNLNYLMMGCLGAIFYARNREHPSLHNYLKPAYVFCAIVLAFTLTFLDVMHVFSYTSLACLLVFPVLWLYLVIYMVHTEDGKAPSMFSSLGKYTYGMYFYHPIFLISARVCFDALGIPYSNNILNTVIIMVISFAVTVVISIVSYTYFEKPILSLKAKFSQVETRI